jgi:C-terminal processing protease CtpA/Prc
MITVSKFMKSYMVDGTITTQPEFSFWFKDVGSPVENYGTDPDSEVDAAPRMTCAIVILNWIAPSLGCCA